MLSGFYFCTLKLEAVCCFKMFIIVYQAAWCDITVMKCSFDNRKAAAWWDLWIWLLRLFWSQVLWRVWCSVSGSYRELHNQSLSFPRKLDSSSSLSERPDYNFPFIFLSKKEDITTRKQTESQQLWYETAELGSRSIQHALAHLCCQFLHKTISMIIYLSVPIFLCVCIYPINHCQ
jgi:hypothetical protein